MADRSPVAEQQGRYSVKHSLTWCLLAFIATNTVFAQPTKKAPPLPTQPTAAQIEAEKQAAVNEMEALMSTVRVPFPKSDVPDEAKPICVAGRKALAVRYGAYGSILWDIDVGGHPVSCK